jgi:pyrimidine-nucleoside phosphorylase
MVVPRLIERKRDGMALEPGAWTALIQAYVAGEVPDYQVAALAMAVVFRGLAAEELSELVEAMLSSGDRLDFGAWPVPRVDKHSIGGVGDKTSLLLAPMLACAGVAVPMISGRGLGHTGGTLDKLESIRGFRTRLSLDETLRQVRDLGVAMIGQTPELVPADRKLYALRDVTGTVESIPLIAASIMSKKLAEDLTGLVLDIKTGSGSFMPERAQSLDLARTMVAIGEAKGCRTVALLTAMDRPLGWACGNALEMAEAIHGLQGEGPEDLMEVTYALGVEMLLVAGVETVRTAARERLEGVVQSGAALDKFASLVEAQGGDPAVVRDPERLPKAAVRRDVVASIEGAVQRVDPRTIGYGVIGLGGGRQRTTDHIDPAVGFVIRVKPGMRVERGEHLATIHAADAASADAAEQVVERAISIGDPLPVAPLVSHRLDASGLETLEAG